MGEANTAGTSKAMEEFMHCVPSARQLLRHFPESRASARTRVTLEDKYHNHKHHPLSPFSRLLLLNMSDGLGFPSGQLSWLCPLAEGEGVQRGKKRQS